MLEVKGQLPWRAFLILALSSAVLAYLAPAEETLGQSYKLLYLHLPLLYTSTVSLILCPALTLMGLRTRRLYNLGPPAALLGIAFGAGSLLAAELLAVYAWGGTTTSEPRFVASILIYVLFALYIPVYWAGRPRAAAFYSLAATAASFYIYYAVVLSGPAPFHLHPSGVEMPLAMRLPLLPATLAAVALYTRLFTALEKYWR